jgi:hypothetical protein
MNAETFDLSITARQVEGRHGILAILPHFRAAVGTLEGSALIPTPIDLHADGLAANTFDDVARKRIHGLEISNFHTLPIPLFSGSSTIKNP